MRRCRNRQNWLAWIGALGVWILGSPGGTWAIDVEIKANDTALPFFHALVTFV